LAAENEVASAGMATLAGMNAYLAVAVVGLPLLASLLIFFFGKRMWRGGAMIAILGVGGSLLIALRWFWGMLAGSGVGAEPSGIAWRWYEIGTLHFDVGFLFDNLSIWLSSLVALLSLLIVIFSTHYLHEEPNEKLRRYYAVKALFIAGMLGTVLMDNYLLMFMFWEVMGLCSYLLIGYWYEKASAAQAAKKAFLTTRLGDILLMMGLFLVLIEFRTLSYHTVFEMIGAGQYEETTLFWAAMFIFGGAVGKSAQFPLDIWLPDAMEGPTTVSALIHAATMVKAGVYLVARSFPLFVAVPDTFVVIGVIGGFTALYTASMALAATDIKRVLAFSTLSQLGYMFLALGAGGILYVHTLAEGSPTGIGFTAAMLHLMNHAFFKALLFLGAGSVILGLHHHQDLREMGGLRKKMPKTYVTMLIASLSIAGIVPLSGFWSKDEVLATAFEAGHADPVFSLLWVMGVVTAGLTAFYMFRMMYLAFHGKARTEHAEHAHESPAVMTVPLMILAVFAFASGLWLVADIGGGFENVIHYPYSEAVAAGVHAHIDTPGYILGKIIRNPLTYLSLAVAIGGILVARARYGKGLPASEEATPTRGWRGLLYRRYYVTELVYEPLGNYVAMGVARLSAWFDRAGIDGAVNGVARVTDEAGARTRRWQGGRLTTYMASIAFGALALLLIVWQIVPFILERWR
jgi:proton-translocating NADH-quinone oxidoreductase chain L